VQEALHNVAKHAQAKTVNIQISRQDGQVVLLIEDDGVGISSAKPHSRERQTFGLEGMKERIGVLGGELRIWSSKGQGTRLQISVPAERSTAQSVLAQVLPDHNPVVAMTRSASAPEDGSRPN
jgi:signal transduction histidine kinase